MPLATSNVNKLNCVLAANRINIIAFSVICVRRLFSLSYALHCLFFLPLFLPCFVHKMLPRGIVAGFAVYFYCWILMPRAAMCQLKLQLQNSHSNPLFLRLLLPFPVSLLAGTLIYSAWAIPWLIIFVDIHQLLLISSRWVNTTNATSSFTQT